MRLLKVDIHNTTYKPVLLGLMTGRDSLLTVSLGLYSLWFLTWVAFQWGGPSLRMIVSDTAMLPAAGATTWLVIRASQRGGLDGRTRKAWQVIALACMFLFASDALRLANEVFLHGKPFPSPADVVHLAFYPIMLWGILYFPGRYRSKPDQVKFWIDVATVMLGAGIVLWYLILYPLVHTRYPDLVVTTLSIAYPLGDLALLFGITTVTLDRQAMGRRGSLGLLVAGLCLFFLADTGLAYLSLGGTYSSGEWPDALLMLAMLAFAIGARYQIWSVRANTGQATADRQQNHSGLNPLPYLAVLVGYGLLAADTIVGNGESSRTTGLVFGAGALTLLAMLRQVVMIRENTNLMAERIAYASQERFHSLVQNSADLITVLSADGTILYHSPSLEKVLGYKPEETVNNSIFSYLYPGDTATAQTMILEALHSPGKNVGGEFRMHNANGNWVHVETIGINLLDNPNVRGILLNSRDITVRKALEERLKHQAFHEPLTGLPNRTLFIDRLKHALVRAKVVNGALGVMFLDLDNFKLVNDTFEHKVGDQLLIEVGKLLQECLRHEDTVARLGGDEFAILIEGLGTTREAAEIAGRISQAMSEPFNLEGHEVFISSSIGIVLSRGGMDRPDDLLRKADVAMFDAKGHGKARHAIFDPGMTSKTTERLRLETEMRRALEREEFEVYYQPVVDIRSGKISEVEALVRWKHPGRGLVQPGSFIPLAEETGLIVPLGLWVLRKACKQVRLWQIAIPGCESLTLSANLSARQLQHPLLIEDLKAALKDSGLVPYRLKLEITESVAMDDAESAAVLLQRLKELGIKLAIDDFGTGYSTLSYLKRYSVDTLKIDGSLIRGIAQSPEDMAIVRAAIAFAKALNLTVTAEGIETEDQLIRLKAQGCDFGQGYLFSKPVSMKEMTIRLKSSKIHKPFATMPLREIPQNLTRPLPTSGPLSHLN